MTYTSIKTGTVYEILPEKKWYNDYDKNGNVVKVEYTQYSILKDNRLVQFALSPDKIAEQVAHYEGESDGIWSSRFD